MITLNRDTENGLRNHVNNKIIDWDVDTVVFQFNYAFNGTIFNWGKIYSMECNNILILDI